MSITREFKYCSCCGSPRLDTTDERFVQCPDCGFILYRNAAATSSAIIEVGEDILLVKRARDPAKDLFDFPGGFVDFRETAEQTVYRELEEELGLILDCQLEYICNFPNTYLYEGIEYHTLDMFYRVRLAQKPELKPADDVAGFMWTTLETFDRELAAFDSVIQTLNAYSNHIKKSIDHIP